ncbi:hypothetical protein EKO27_g559 [Xylaria grammica]|uniref:Uncharacterized protein n=1 Tax=Xylaria grammica TaxID=363999 RepID=A0A439DJ90_9PEZI|nr:hypothetical protein EKO27_g559 [Xylaria grammica]
MNTIMACPSSGPALLLDHDHYAALDTAVRRVLATDLAFETYAQIIDGLPTFEVARDRRYKTLFFPNKGETPFPENPFPSRAHSERPVQLLRSFQCGTLFSRRFQLRLLELVAVALHQLAVCLFQKDYLPLHDRFGAPCQSSAGASDIQAVTSWTPPPLKSSLAPAKAPLPTLFAHPAFIAHEQYPDGVGDMVGYWAEDRILGGVSLFDRSQLWENGDEEPNIYFQSSRPQKTWWIWQLTDGQQQELLRFVCPEFDRSPGNKESDVQDPICPLPISFRQCRERRSIVDPEYAVVINKIYRDAWERPPPRSPNGFIRGYDLLVERKPTTGRCKAFVARKG